MSHATSKTNRVLEAKYKELLTDYLQDKGMYMVEHQPNELQKTNFNGFYENHKDEKSGLGKLHEYMSNIRAGIVYDRHGLPMEGITPTPRPISLREAVRELYGVSLDKFFLAMDIDLRYFSFENIYAKLVGNSQVFSLQKLEELCLQYSEKQSFTNTRDVPSDFRFILPEIILDAVNVAYEYSAMHNRWVASTTQLTQTEAKMPYVKDGDTMPKYLQEGESIPIGSISYGNKTVITTKLGIGIKLTDELMRRSSINFLTIFLRMVGYKIAMASDNFAMFVLVNGEQSGNTEAAYSTGVTTANSYDYAAIDNALSAMEQARFMPDIAIGKRAEMNFELSTPERPRETVKQYLTKEGLQTMMFPAPNSSVVLIDSQNALMKLTFGTQTFERQRDPSTQTETFYMSMYIGFATIRRDARLILNRSITTGIPTAYDAEVYIASQNFKS